MTEITLNVPQGIGDNFWIYQKFAPHVDRINFMIEQFEGPNSQGQNRSVDFLRLLPKVGQVGKLFVTGHRYGRTAGYRFPMKGVLERAKRGHPSCDYSCNYPLEQGVRIEEIDPEYAVQETVPLPDTRVDLPGDYLVVFVACAATFDQPEKVYGHWPVAKWVDLVTLLYERRGLSWPVVVIGASWDEKAAQMFSAGIRAAGLRTILFIQRPAREVVHILRGARFFVGHQSGLNILADNLDVPQLMVYTRWLDKMQYAWCKRAHAGDGTFNAALFPQTPDEIVERLRWTP